jgi:hypothetical protein
MAPRAASLALTPLYKTRLVALADLLSASALRQDSPLSFSLYFSSNSSSKH